MPNSGLNSLPLKEKEIPLADAVKSCAAIAARKIVRSSVKSAPRFILSEHVWFPAKEPVPLIINMENSDMTENTVTLAHGAGGSLTSELIDRVFKAHFANRRIAYDHYRHRR